MLHNLITSSNRCSFNLAVQHLSHYIKYKCSYNFKVPIKFTFNKYIK